MAGYSQAYYTIVPPEGGKAKRHTRVTTIANVLDDTSNLEKWKGRMIAKGLAARPDLLGLASVTSVADKSALNRICEDAKEAAAGSAKANFGNALHTLTEQIDRGEQPAIPPQFAQDVAAYNKALAFYGIEILRDYIEAVCVCTELGEPVAGTLDRIVRRNGRLYVADLKTGEDLKWSWRKIAVQLAIYSRASSLYDRETEQHSEMPEVDQDHGIVFHLPTGKGRCQPFLVDLREGWRAAELSVEVRRWRKHDKLAEAIEVAA